MIRFSIRDCTHLVETLYVGDLALIAFNKASLSDTMLFRTATGTCCAFFKITFKVMRQQRVILCCALRCLNDKNVLDFGRSVAALEALFFTQNRNRL